MDELVQCQEHKGIYKPFFSTTCRVEQGKLPGGHVLAYPYWMERNEAIAAAVRYTAISPTPVYTNTELGL